MNIRYARSLFNEETSKDPVVAANKNPPLMVSLQGRIILRRNLSKNLIFLTIQDEHAEIQVALAKQISPDVLNIEFGLWDLVCCQGVPAYTKAGEPTIWLTSFKVESRCHRLPPDKVEGVNDKEICYRQRYLDLITNEESRKIFKARSAIIALIRWKLGSDGFIEVETPMIESFPSGAAASPFKTHHDALNLDVYLRIATEICLKKLIIGGFERVYEIGRIFRNEGLSTKHNPEFTSIELYSAYTNLKAMMDLAEGIVQVCSSFADGYDFSGPRKWNTPFKVVEYSDLMHGHPMTDEYFSEHIEPTLIEPTFVCGQPIGDSPLCQARKDDPTKADRFELYINGMEIANSYQELTDPVEQKKRLIGQPFVDEDFITALEYGMPPTAGMGIGIDRLVMAITGAKSIRDVILFPTMRPI